MFKEATTTSPDMFIIIVWAFFIGIVIATVYSVVIKSVLGKFVKKLIKAGSVDKKSAKSLSELELEGKGALKFVLSKSTSQVYRFVSIVDKEDIRHQKRTKIKPEDEKYYIEEKNQDGAKAIFGTKGSGVLVPVIALVIFFIVALLIVNFAPTVFEKIKGIFSW